MLTCAFALHKAPSTLCQDIRSSQGNGSLGISSQATALSRDVKVSAVTVLSIIHKHMSPSFLALGHAVCPSRSLVASRPVITLSLSHVRYTGTEEASRVSKQLMQPQKRHTIEQVVQRHNCVQQQYLSGLLSLLPAQRSNLSVRSVWRPGWKTLEMPSGMPPEETVWCKMADLKN
jgi:hypothetical protein